MTDLDRLWQLQQLDLRLLGLRQAAEGHPARRDLEEGQRRLAEVEAELAESVRAAAELRRLVRKGEFEVRAGEEEVRRLETRLFDGSVTNPKELGSLQGRLESERAKLGRLQDEVLQQMIELERLEERHRALQEQAAELRQRIAELTARWAAVEAELRAEMERLQCERQALAGAVTQPLWLSRYERLFSAKGGQALAQIVDGRCSGCGLPLPNLLLEAARRGDRQVFCEVCGRILYWPRGQKDG